MTTQVELIHDDHVSRIRLTSKKGIQVLSANTRAALSDAVDELSERTACRVVVFEAEGRTFLAGADIAELQGMTAEEAERCSRETHDLFDRIESLEAVTIAAIHAACAGGGFELALACDLRYAAASAKIGLPEVTLGLIPGFGGTVRMVELFGHAVARHVMLRGELLDANEAQRLGLVTKTTADDSFRELVDAETALIASRSPTAIRTVKALLRSHRAGGAGSAFNNEAEQFGDSFETADGIEGIAAFLEKREANWEVNQ